MRFVILAAFLFAIGCATSSTTPTDDRQGANELRKGDDSAQRAKLLEIVANYKKLEKVDEQMRFAPALCAPAMRPKPEHRLSRSTDESTHGKKLYALFAAKVDSITRSYTGESMLAGRKEPMTGQVIVKESWLAEPLKEGEGDITSPAGPDGKRYKTVAKGPLFVMYQTDPKDPNSDEGWVYGTLTPDGKTVTGVGKLENCMSCHQKAPHGRLFGLPKD